MSDAPETTFGNEPDGVRVPYTGTCRGPFNTGCGHDIEVVARTRTAEDRTARVRCGVCGTTNYVTKATTEVDSITR